MNTTDLQTAIAKNRAEMEAVLLEADAIDPKYRGIIERSGYLRAEKYREVLAQIIEARDYAPQVGDGMSIDYPQDSYPLVITRVSPSGKTVWCKPVRTVDRSTGHEPARHDGPWPVWHHIYTAEELQTYMEAEASERQVTRSRDGLTWSMSGTPISRGALYHRNYSY